MYDKYRVDDGQTLSSSGPITRADQRQDISFPTRIRIFISDSSTASNRETAREKFTRLEKKWKRETQYMSALSDKYLHESYASIIGMGPAAVPLILKSLDRFPTDWFYALRAITSVNPVADSDAGDVTKMANAWLKWGAEKGLV